MILIRLEGEPANGPIARAHSLALGAVLAETDVVEIASSNGDTATLPFIGIDAGVAGFSSGDCARGESKGGDASLAVLPLVNLAPCLVTAATTPLPSLTFLSFFFEPGIGWC